MENQKEIKLSSGWSVISLYIGAILLILVSVIIYLFVPLKMDNGVIIGGLIYLMLFCFVVYLFMYMSTAKVIDGKVILKKQFRPAKSYEFDKIGELSSFRIKRSKYTTIEMKNNDGSIEKYVIMNSSALLSFENQDAEEILFSLKRIGRLGKIPKDN
ncbi:hypothetical protein KRX57_03860 [Weeksellaceae bacterium TAE3-ERU29]|nr:hypothetical protein [Weeksellaceae bacterium TAE3-ERU29]